MAILSLTALVFKLVEITPKRTGNPSQNSEELRSVFTSQQ